MKKTTKKSYIIKGVKYDSIKGAAKKLKVDYSWLLQQVKRRIDSDGEQIRVFTERIDK